MFEVYLSREAEKIYRKADPKTTRLLDNCFRQLEQSPLASPNIKRLKGKLERSFRGMGTKVLNQFKVFLHICRSFKNRRPMSSCFRIYVPQGLMRRRKIIFILEKFC